MAELMPPATTPAAGGGPASLDIRVLGPLEVTGGDGLPLLLGAPKVRTLLAILVLAEGRPLTAATLVDRIWGPRAPAKALGSLQVYVSHLRRLLEPGRLPRAPSRVLTFDSAGYRLTVARERVDVTRFLALVAEAEHAADPRAVERAAAGALALWRGEPYADLGGQEYVAAAVARLTEARERARELRVSAVLRQGRHREVVGELEALTHEHPLREPLWALRALALYRCGRQGEALQVLRAVRRTLAEELGIDPGDELRELERHILRQSPHLRPPGTRSSLPVPPSSRCRIRSRPPGPPAAPPPVRPYHG
ncbi:AfsR/SARP family transcriptional regulator [Microbispora sp. CA-135349]|uniref:AfsR/SARP family transcriptional regulator n=1 Tax=Microbispora sp. CA-135349 TaxID=3239953 RepID=UPI003D94A955